MGNKTKASLTLAGLALTGLNCSGMEASDVLLFSKGPVTLRPEFQTSETFNDNIFYRDVNRASDFITIVSPGLNLQVGEQEFNYIRLGYSYDRLVYAENPDQDANQHHLSLEDRFEKNRLTLAGRDQIDLLSSVLGGGISLEGVKVARTVYLDDYRLSYHLTDKTGVYVEGVHSATDFTSDVPLYDYETLTGSAGFEYAALSHTSFFGEVYYGQSATPPNAGLAKPPHADFIGGFLGAKGNFTDKLTGTIKAGFESREFSDHSSGGNLPVVELSLTERFTEDMQLSLGYYRRQLVSAQFYRVAYTSDQIILSWLQDIGNDNRFHMTARLEFDGLNYQSNPAFDQRTDMIYSGSLAFVYDFKIWLHGTISYNHESLRSDLAGIVDYDVNRVTAGLSVGY